MSFLNVYNALYNQVKAYSTLTDYVAASQFLRGFRDPMPQQKHTVVFEPGDDSKDHQSQSSGKLKEVDYSIDVYARVILPKGIEYSIIGDTDNDVKGVLEFVDDIVAAIESDLTLSYNRYGSSISAANSGSTFALTAAKRYLTISMDGKTPIGYDTIDCGVASLSGAAVASNIQDSLQALGTGHNDDPYETAVCTFDSSIKEFMVYSTSRYGPKSSVIITAGSSLDCSELLGFDSPTEVVGRNILSIRIGPVRGDNSAYPVRYRIIPVTVREEILT